MCILNDEFGISNSPYNSIVGAMVLDTVFAFDVSPGDPMIKLVEKAADTAIETIAAGVWMGMCLRSYFAPNVNFLHS